MVNDKPLPHNIENEQASLGSMLSDKDALALSVDFLIPENFYLKTHQIIYKNILALSHKDQAVDLVTLTEELKKKELLDKIGGITYLTQLMNSVPTTANIKHYNQIIKEKYMLRNNIIQLNEIIDLCYKGIDPKTITEKIQNIMVNTSQEEEEKNLNQLLNSTLLSSSQGTKYKINLKSLNHLLGGIDPCETITIGGYTSQGKTSLALQLCKDFCEQQLKVLYCTSEMSDQETARRLLANMQEKNIMDFRRGRFSENEKASLYDFIELMAKSWKLEIKKVYQMKDITKYVHKYEPNILFIDYLQNLSRNEEKYDYQKVTHDMQDIQILTRDKEITTFVLSQLSRNKETAGRR